MATTWKKLVQGGTVTGTATAFYTAPGGTYATIQAASVNNPTAGVVVVNFYRVIAAGSATTANKIASRSVPAGATSQFPELVNVKFEPTDQLFADGNGTFLNVSGAEYVPE